jgi:hypothetical protein
MFIVHENLPSSNQREVLRKDIISDRIVSVLDKGFWQVLTLEMDKHD